MNLLENYASKQGASNLPSAHHCSVQTMQDQVSKSKALTNAIIGKRKRDDNDDDEIDNSKILKMARLNQW